MSSRDAGGSRLDAQLGAHEFEAQLEAALAAHRNTCRLLESLASCGLCLTPVDSSCDRGSPEWEKLVSELSARVLQARTPRSLDLEAS